MWIILLTYLVTDFAVYVWHRWISHFGLGGNIFRNAHYEHHEIHYPFAKLETNEYIPNGWIDGDTWPWFIPITICMSIYIALCKLDCMSVFNCYIGLTFAIIYTYITSYINQSYHIRNHWLNKFNWFRRHKFYHKLHHYYNCNYSITTFIMDRIFGTLVTRFDGPNENLFPDLIK